MFWHWILSNLLTVVSRICRSRPLEAPGRCDIAQQDRRKGGYSSILDANEQMGNPLGHV